MIRKSGRRFSEQIMPKQTARGTCEFCPKPPLGAPFASKTTAAIPNEPEGFHRVSIESEFHASAGCRSGERADHRDHARQCRYRAAHRCGPGACRAAEDAGARRVLR